MPPTPFDQASRLGLLGNDAAGFPNGRRPLDDVTDIVLRVVVGGVLAGAEFNDFPNTNLGDGVNIDDTPVQASFPYVAPAPGRTQQPPHRSGRARLRDAWRQCELPGQLSGQPDRAPRSAGPATGATTSPALTRPRACPARSAAVIKITRLGWHCLLLAVAPVAGSAEPYTPDDDDAIRSACPRRAIHGCVCSRWRGRGLPKTRRT